MRSCSRRSFVVTLSFRISRWFMRPSSMRTLGLPPKKFLSLSLFIERKEIDTWRNRRVNMAVTPLMRETSGDSMGMEASSAIINDIIIWKGDIFDSSAFPIILMTKSIIMNTRSSVISIILKSYTSRKLFEIFYCLRKRCLIY